MQPYSVVLGSLAVIELDMALEKLRMLNLPLNTQLPFSGRRLARSSAQSLAAKGKSFIKRRNLPKLETEYRLSQ